MTVRHQWPRDGSTGHWCAAWLLRGALPCMFPIPLDGARMPRIYTPPRKTLDRTAPFWEGDTAVRVMKKRVKQYEKDAEAKATARRKKSAASRRAR